MARFFAFVVQHRIKTLIGLALATGFFVAQYPRAKLATDLFEVFLDEPEVVDAYRRAMDEFGSDIITIVAFDADDTFTADGIDRLQAAVDELEQHPDAARVMCLVTANRIEGTEDTLIVRPYVDELEETPEWFAYFRAEIANHELYRDLLLSRDGRMATIIIEGALDETRRAEEARGILAGWDEILDRHGIAAGARHTLGFVATTAEVIRESQFNMVRVFPLAIVTVFLVGWLLFRALWPTLLTLGVAGLAVLWVMGFAILLSPEINILITIVPVVILVLAFADVIHLTNAYLTSITDGLPQEEAVLTSATEVGPACLYTSITTLLGFGAFAVVPAEIMRKFAVIMGFGTASALFISVTLVPAVFSLFRAPAPRRRGLSASHGSPLDRALLWCERIGRERPALVGGAAVLIVAVCAVQASRLHVETDMVDRFAPDHPLSVAYRYLTERMASGNTAEIIIETPEPDGVYDPEFLRAVQRLQDAALALPLVDSAVALTDLLEIIHREMNPGDVEPGELPDSRDLAAQYVFLFELGDADELNALVNYERNRLRMSLRLTDTGMKNTFDTAEALLAQAKTILPEGVTASATGHMVILGRVMRTLIAGQVRGLISAMLTITAVFVIAFRSVRAALGGMIVNFMPMLVFFGTIHWFNPHFDSDYIVIAAVALGIAVDDTIHFMHRYRLELGRGHAMNDAIRRTIEHTGKPIVQTTLIIFLGFAPFNLTSYTSSRAFGAMLGCTLIWALLADLLVLPVMIRAGLVPLPVREPAEVEV